MKPIYFAMIFLFMVTMTAFSQKDTIESKDLSEVVVTGQYKPQSVRTSVYQVRTISRERIQKQGATRLQDVLTNELNMRFSQDLATGGSDITMMGLKGQNVKILIDGMPMIGRQGATNEININQVDVNNIERIEIVEGPMSVVYGADALAGVINIITKKSSKAKIAVNARIHEESVGSEYGIKQGIHNQYAGLSYRHKNWELGGAAGRNYFGGWKDTALGRELVWHKKDQLIGNGFIGYKKGKFSARYRVDGLDEIITNPGNFEDVAQSGSGDTLAFDQEYLSQRVMHQLQSAYYVNSDLNFQLQGSFTDYSRQVFSTTLSKTSGDVRLNPAPGSQTMVGFKGWNVRATGYYKLSSIISFQPGIDINTEKGEGERLKQGTNAVSDYALFITSEITPSDKIQVRPGLRFSKNSVYNSPPLIPSINSRFVLSSELDLRLSYARGFRAPSLRELYFDFFDANHQILGNPDLRAETSHSFNGSITWKKAAGKQIVLGAFYNSVRDLIDYAPSTTNPNIFILTNVSNSKTAGLNMTATAKMEQWTLNAGASYTGFYNDYSETDESLPELQWSAEANAIVGYTFGKIGLDANLFYKFTGKRPFYAFNTVTQEILLTEQEGFHLADLTINKKLGKYIVINAGIRNLFDVDRIRSTVTSTGVHAGNGTRNIAVGRSFFAGLTFNWEKF